MDLHQVVDGTLEDKSYDRFFPSQNTMPKGGFGNLIALALQREAREVGNTHLVPEFQPSPLDPLDLILLMKDIRRSLG